MATESAACHIPQSELDQLFDREYQQKNYHALGCSDVLQDVYRIYLESVPPKLERIRILLEADDLESLVAVAHGLKGESGSVGGRQVMELAAALEKAARAGAVDQARSLLPGLEQQVARILLAIRQELTA